MAEWRPRTLGLPARVSIIMLLVCLATMVSGSVAMYKALSMDDDEMLDGRLVALAALVLNLARTEVRALAEEGISNRVHQDSDGAFGALYRYQLWSADGRLLLRTDKAPANAPFGPLSAHGFRNVTVDGANLRVLTMTSVDGNLILQMAECLDERDMDIAAVSRRFLMFVGLPLCVIGLLAYKQLGLALTGLADLASQVQRRGIKDLSPIDSAHLPSELAEMLGAINSVFQRVDSGVRAEQEFASMAAHELRAPLAGLRAQAQLAQSLQDLGQIQSALRSVIEATDQAARVIDQLLDLAKFEVLSLPRALPPLAMVDLWEVVYEAIEDVERLRRLRGVLIEPLASEVTVSGHRGGLLAIARNLLSNALRYTPPGGRVVVIVAAADDEVTLTVEDSGPGIAPEQRAAALQRFNRLGRSDGEGAGLGLAIVQSVVRLHRAGLELSDSPLGGLRVDVRLHKTAPDARQLRVEEAQRSHKPAVATKRFWPRGGNLR